MEIKFSVKGIQRKSLVLAIAELTGQRPTYLGAPSFTYEVGGYRIDAEGTLTTTEETNVEALLARLMERGFQGVPTGEGADVQTEKLSIEMPLEGFSENAIEKLERLIASKASLIRKAVGVSALSIEKREDRLCFPWFEAPCTQEELQAYTLLVTGLCDAAKKKQRVNAKEKTVENEKFTFRVFLLQLGFVGGDYKQARKILLRNLTGNSAFRSGRPQASSEVTTNE